LTVLPITDRDQQAIKLGDHTHPGGVGSQHSPHWSYPVAARRGAGAAQEQLCPTVQARQARGVANARRLQVSGGQNCEILGCGLGAFCGNLEDTHGAGEFVSKGAKNI
jgi:hypothetical protein